MGIKRIKVSTYIDIDDVTEKDLAETLQKMIDSRQLSAFSTNAIKLVLENQELLNRCKVGEKQVFSTREKFFSDLTNKVRELEKTQLLLEEEVQKLVEFIKLRKMIGIEEKVDNAACTQFLIKRQMKLLNKQLGRIGTDLVIDRRAVDKDILEMNKKADELIEFVVEHYDGIINELKQMMIINMPIQERVIETVREVKEVKGSREENGVSIEPLPEIKTEKKESKNAVEILLGDDEAMGALEDMFA